MLSIVLLSLFWPSAHAGEIVAYPARGHMRLVEAAREVLSADTVSDDLRAQLFRTHGRGPLVVHALLDIALENTFIWHRPTDREHMFLHALFFAAQEDLAWNGFTDAELKSAMHEKLTQLLKLLPDRSIHQELVSEVLFAQDLWIEGDVPFMARQLLALNQGWRDVLYISELLSQLPKASLATRALFRVHTMDSKLNRRVIYSLILASGMAESRDLAPALEAFLVRDRIYQRYFDPEDFSGQARSILGELDRRAKLEIHQRLRQGDMDVAQLLSRIEERLRANEFDNPSEVLRTLRSLRTGRGLKDPRHGLCGGALD